MPRYKITSDDDEPKGEFKPREFKKKTDNERFGDQTIPGLGLYTIPKMRTNEAREKTFEVREDITKHVALSERPWYKSSMATRDLVMTDPASHADINAGKVMTKRSRVKHTDYAEVEYTNTKSYTSSIYGFGKSGRNIEETLANVREDKKAASAAKNDRLKKEWLGEAPRAAVPMCRTKEDMMLYSMNDYLEVQKAQEAELEEMIEEMTPHRKFKTRKEIRKEKFGIDEDEDEILFDKINIPRRKEHEIGTPIDELHDRHKSLVTATLDRRTQKLEKAKADLKEYDSDEELLVDVRSPAWLSKGSSIHPGTGSSQYSDRFNQTQKSELKLDTLEDLLNYNPLGHIEATSTADDFEALKELKPREYASMKDPDFLKSKFKRFYSDPMAGLVDDSYKKLMKDVTYETARCFVPGTNVHTE